MIGISNLGYRFEHLGRILAECRHDDRLGVCFDTCHVLAAGYEFRDAATYREMFRAFDRKHASQINTPGITG